MGQNWLATSMRLTLGGVERPDVSFLSLRAHTRRGFLSPFAYPNPSIPPVKKGGRQWLFPSILNMKGHSHMVLGCGRSSRFANEVLFHRRGPIPVCDLWQIGREISWSNKESLD